MSNRRFFQHLSLLCTGALLLACADGARQLDPARAGLADGAYQQARLLHLAGRYDAAVVAYRQVLAAMPRHVRARNALAAALAHQGQFNQAIPIWQGLTGEVQAGSGPDGAYLFANLGYAYLLSGDLEHAVSALEKACVLDPLDHRAWRNLGETLRQLGQDARASAMLRQAEALEEHDFRSDHAVAGGSTVAAIEAALAQPAREDAAWARTEVRTAADGTLELVRVPPAMVAATSVPAALPAPRPPVQLPAPAVPATLALQAPSAALLPVAGRPGTVLLEIRNGNGVTNMARSVSRQIGSAALQVTRLSNAPGFQVQSTRIEYQGAYRAAAEGLAARLAQLPGAPALTLPIVQVAHCKPADLRLVLGQDLVAAALFAPVSPRATSLAASRQAKPVLAAAAP